ncbi:MAG: DUF169 domain-containing protein [Marinilabiliales bacterium]|nr:DUF169 domain-containing protein [Marinilabiliales bacterium]
MVEILGIDYRTPSPSSSLGPESPPPAAPFKKVTGHRYCQLLIVRRHGESVLLDPNELACPAAAAAFGFRPLPEGLATGKGLVGFGIVEEPDTGRRMFENMPHLEPGRVTLIAAAPSAPSTPSQTSSWSKARRKPSCGSRSPTSTWPAESAAAAIPPFSRQPAWTRPSSPFLNNASIFLWAATAAERRRTSDRMNPFSASRGRGSDRLIAALESLAKKAVGRSRAKAVLENHKKKENSHE